MKKLLYLIINIIMFSTISVLAYAYETTNVSVSISNNIINAQKIDNEWYVFLPSHADLTALSLNVGENDFNLSGNLNNLNVNFGDIVDITALSSADIDGAHLLKIKTNDSEINIKILKSSNVSSMFIKSDDPIGHGRNYVDLVKGNKASGQVTVTTSDGRIVYNGSFKEIKGRGNSTWTGSDKKPYQIKLGESANLLNDNNADNENKTWVLLANSFDPTLIRNTMTYNLAKEIGMSYSPDCMPVDLYYDNEYRGSYLLSEKVEISKGRIDITNLEDVIEKAGISAEISYSEDTNAYGSKFKYANEPVVPDNTSWGFLLEYEYADRVEEENCWFATTNGSHIVIKSPENLPKSFVKRLSERYQEFEDAVYNGGVNPNNGRPYTDFVNLDSLVKMFAIEQFSKDIDAFTTSTYMYLDENLEFNYGPVWDFDIAYGIGSNNEADENQLTTGLTVFNTDFCKKIMSISSFRKQFTEFYNKKFTPIVENIILGGDSGNFLQSLNSYVSQVYNSQIMNSYLWKYSGFRNNITPWIFDDYFENVDYLENFILNRHQWIKNSINNSSDANIKKINIYTYYDEVNDNVYYSLGENNYYYLKFLSIEDGLMKLKHLSGIEYSDNLEVYVNDVKTEYSIDDLECVIVKIPDKHNIMAPKKENIIFKDVNSDSWYHDYVYNVYNKGWMKGVTEKRFQPDEPLKKGMVLTALFRLSNSEGAKHKFAISSECYNDTAIWAINENIIFEHEKDFMRFKENITRQEAAVLFYKASGKPKIDYSLAFSDNYKIDSYAVDAIKWCVKNGIFSGDNKNRLNPDKYLSRAEFTKMLSVYANL